MLTQVKVMDENTFRIRLGKVEDSTFLAESALKMLYDAEGKQMPFETAEAGVRKIFEQGARGFYVIAQKGEQSAGSMMIAPLWLDLMDGCYWWIQCVHVREIFRRQGCLAAMYEFVLNLAKADKNVRGLRLRVNERNATARDAYEKLGMQIMPFVNYQQRWSQPPLPN
jgi:GNAT superfamily N-acetyltransferase